MCSHFMLKLVAFSFVPAEHAFGVAGAEVEMQLADMRTTRPYLQQADFSGAVTPITANTPGR